MSYPEMYIYSKAKAFEQLFFETHILAIAIIQNKFGTRWIRRIGSIYGLF